MGTDPGRGDGGNDELRSETGTETLDRRSFLAAAGATVAGTAALGEVASRGAAAVRAGDFQFDTVLDAVEDLGADPNGGGDVVPLIEGAYRSGVKVEFPPGEYRLGSSWVDTGSSVSNFGLVGTGNSRRDVQFVVPDGRFNDSTALALRGPKSDHLFRNFSIRLGDDGDRAFPIRIDTTDGTLFEDVEWLGSVADQNTSSKGQVIAIATTAQDGVNTARRLVIGKDAAAQRPGYPEGRAAIRVDGAHDGEMVLADCHVERQGSSSFRLAEADGVLTVLGGRFVNNDNTNVRFSGGNHPTKHSVVDGAEVVVDDVAHAAQAIHVDNSSQYHSGAVVRNVDVRFTDPTAGQPAIESPSWADHGSITFENCRVHNDVGVQAIEVDDVSMSDDEITIEGCSFTGTGGGIDVAGRAGSVIRDSCFDMPNGDVSGTIDVENVSRDGCPTPSFGDDDGGDTTDPSVAVSTGDATGVGETDATLAGSLTDLGGASSAEVAVEYRQSGAESWSTAATKTLSSTGSFGADATDLAAGTDYEYRAAADAGDGDTDTGSTATFTTDTSGLGHDLRIDGSDVGSLVEYEVTVGGDLAKGEYANPNDAVEGSTAVGQVNGGFDTYTFSGEVTDVVVSEPVPVYVDGDRLDLSQFGLDRDLRVDGSDVGSLVEYEVTVSGDLAKDEYANPNDAVEGSTAVGQVNGGFDTYDFSGEVTDVVVSEPVPVYVDGDRLDLSPYLGSAPTVERYEVTEADSRNPDLNVTVEYDVTDEDGDLSTVLVELFDDAGTLVTSTTTDVSGDVAYGVDYLEVENVSGESFEVRATVTDAGGRTDTATTTVTE
jgi:hypothetical protein